MTDHTSTATANLLQARHYSLYFGEPIDGLSDELNASRAATNVRIVANYARAAGMAMYAAGRSVEHWLRRYPDACGRPGVAEALVAGWLEAMATLRLRLTDEQVFWLRQQADERGDERTARLCTAALRGDEGARAECSRAVPRTYLNTDDQRTNQGA